MAIGCQNNFKAELASIFARFVIKKKTEKEQDKNQVQGQVQACNLDKIQPLLI